MLQRPIYQTTIAVLTLAALAGGLWLLVAPDGPPGIEITQPSAGAPVASNAIGQATASDLIDINSATALELADLPGIGAVLSERIVAYRETNGSFQRIDQLMSVSGIGTATFERISSLISAKE